MFAAQDAPDGSTTDSGRVGREVWQVNVDVPFDPTVLANVGQPDRSPSSTFAWQIVGYEPGIFPIPIYGWVLTTVPGIVTGSHPYYLTAADDSLYFSADDGSSGRELWRSDGATTQRVADLAPGSASSHPNHLTPVQTAAGTRLFFTSGGTLCVTDGSEQNTRAVPTTGGVNPFGLAAMGDKLFFQASSARRSHRRPKASAVTSCCDRPTP